MSFCGPTKTKVSDMGFVSLFEDDLLDMIFRNVEPRRPASAKQQAEKQIEEDAMEKWLTENTKKGDWNG